MTSPRTLEMGAKLGPYIIVERIGEGAYARIYSARVEGPMGFQTEVALKVVHEELLESQPDMIRSLVNEARIGGLLSHPNVVRIIDFAEYSGRHVLAMEYVEGPSFRALVEWLNKRAQPLPGGLVAEVGAQVCRALTHAIERLDPEGNALHLVHRDLKPENLILAQGGLVKVLDFGIARSTANLFLTTTLNLTRGTPCYMSPEQLRGEALDGRSDLFALGCVLYELLTGEVLFQEAGFKLVTMVLEGDLSDRLALAHDRSPALTAVLARLIERPVNRRPASALEAEQLLVDVARAEPATPDLAGVARLYSEGATPRFDVPRATTVEEPTEPPSGKAGTSWDRVRSWFLGK